MLAKVFASFQLSMLPDLVIFYLFVS